MRNTSNPIVIGALITLTAFQPILSAASSSNPTGGTFVAGSGKISTSGNVITINQNTLKGIINWNTFSISPGSTVNFNNANGATLNRVTGNAPSTLLGQLISTGNVYLINPQGILIGHGATIHTGGDFLATTLNIPNATFLKGGQLTFSGFSTATVVNLGNLTSTGGSVYLIGNTVQNDGNIQAPNGTTGLAAGSQILLLADATNGQRITVKSPGGDVTNTGFINAAQVELKSNGGNIYALAGNNGGQINATGTATQDGRVWLIASNGITNVSGTISAANADGAGGSIETSGARVNAGGSTIKTGKHGSWLLDPDDLTIDSSLATTIQDSLNSGTNVTESTYAPVNGGNGDILVNSPIAWTSNADLTLSAYRNIALNSGISNTGGGSLTLRADNSATGTGTITGSGVIDFSASTGSVSLLYNPSSYANPTDFTPNFGATNGSWTAPASGIVNSQYTAYMLVNNAANLQSISNNLSGDYALGTDFSASSQSPWTPLGSFTGILNGWGHTISDLSISPVTGNAGLFDDIGLGGILANLNLTSVSVDLTNSSAYAAGALAGTNEGVIYNVTAAGSITSGSTVAAIGGLVGISNGTISNSSAAVNIDTTATTSFNYTGGVGGLVGEADTGTIFNSSASGSINAPSDGVNVGGLVGLSQITLTSDSASASVTGGTNSNVGGLVGYQLDGSISNSSASGPVSAGIGSIVGGLAGVTSGSGTVDSSSASGSVTVPYAATDIVGEYVGGLIGYSEIPVTNSSASGSVIDTNVCTGACALGGTYVGGLVGYSLASIASSSATGNVTGGLQSTSGGLVGVSSGSIDSSYALGSVTVDYSASNAGVENIGGLVGNSTGPITNSYSAGFVTDTNSTGGALGGLVGYSFGTIATSYSFSPVTGGDNAYAGGLVGVARNSITDSYARGTVSAGANSYVGGITALLVGALSTSYSTGTVSGGAGSTVDGLVASGISDTITNSFLDTVSSGASTTTGTGVTTSSLQSGSLPGGFSGTNWSVEAGAYPYFSWQGSLVTIGGTAYNGSSPISSPGISVMSAGVLLESTTANASGAYSFKEPSNMINTAGVLTYLNNSGTANTYADYNYGSMDLYTNSLSVPHTFSNYLSVLAYSLGKTLGSYSGSNFIFSVPGNILTLTSGADLSINNPGGSFNINQSLSDLNKLIISSGADLSIDNSATISANNIILSNLGTFTNNKGAGAFTLGSGRWLIYSSDPGNDSVNGLVPDFFQYNADLNSSLAQGTGNGLIYSIAPSISASLTGVSKSYDGNSNGTLTASNFSTSGAINGDTVTLATPSTGTYFSPNASNSNPVSATGISLVSATNGSIPVYGYSLASSIATGTGVINKDTLTYTAAAANQSYGTSNNSFTGTVTGFVNNENLSSATTGTASFTSGTAATSNVGTYAINGSGLSATNYTFQQAPSNASALTINPALLTYVANASNQTYGSSNNSFNGTVTGLVNGETLSSATTGTASFSSSIAATSPVGTYAINGSGLSATNYSFQQAASNATALTINPALLTYVANPSSQTYGSSISSFTGTVTGLVNGETLSSATNGIATFTSATTATTPAGTYAINGSGLSAANYTFQQAPSNATALTIISTAPTPINVSISNTASVAGQIPTFSATYTGPSNTGLNISSLLSGLTYQISPAFNGPGVYQVTASGAAPYGYAFNVTPGTFTVVDNAPPALPTQAKVASPEIPSFVPKSENPALEEFLLPVNSAGPFQISFGNDFISEVTLILSQNPLSQSLFIVHPGNQTGVYAAGAKP